ncbi:MAG: hypothetical protein GF390_01070 [Candidatus Pacebacteria bacterium]|nr:hypothetical protein [Candidatus Paceibacterota bacterium]
MLNKIIIIILVLLIAAGGYWAFFHQTTPKRKTAQGELFTAKVYKSADCSCCLGHVGYLKGEGFTVETVIQQNLDSIKAKHKIPYNLQSCHTTEIANYFVEGHVPIEAINKLLAEKPDIDGITLPDMPAGSPGMPGLKREEFIIYSLKDGQAKEFMRL